MIDKYKEVRVEWLDACHVPLGWQPIQTYLDQAVEYANLTHYTVGILIEENDDYIVVALDIRGGNSSSIVNMAQCIHRNMIISIKELK